jgi:hypothetical protein
LVEPTTILSPHQGVVIGRRATLCGYSRGRIRVAGRLPQMQTRRIARDAQA